MFAVVIVGLGLLCLVGLIAYAIYRADRDPVFPRPMFAEYRQVRFDHVEVMVREGWTIADEDDASEPGWVLMCRERPKLAPPEPGHAPPNAHRWTDVH